MHTEGRLTAKGDLVCDSSGNPLWDYHDKTPAENEANAHRLAACWNACDGINTEDLEEGNKHCEQPMLQRGLQNMRTLDLMKERDELVATLRFVAEDIAQSGEIEGETLDTVRELLAKYPEPQS